MCINAYSLIIVPKSVTQCKYCQFLYLNQQLSPHALPALKVRSNITHFLIKKLPYDLSSHARLAFIGKYLKRVNVNALIDPKFAVRSGVANSEIL